MERRLRSRNCAPEIGEQMSKRIMFAIALHSHQPVGNFDHVFEDAYQKCYKPFLDILKEYPSLKTSLHYSGPLLDWLEEHHSDYIEALKTMAASGQVEIIGGAYYEPILPLLPRRDRIGQIKMQIEYTRKTFGQEPSGLWLAERVWEQSLVSDMSDAGVKYTLVDDSHFKFAGFRSESITGYCLTEDQGRTVKVFPMDEKLRYYIPFQNPEETIKYLASLATEGGHRVMVYADDGEKFGVWPQTYKHIYEDGWLRRFLDLLQDNSDWLETVTLSEALERTAPLGRIYMPDASYREMMAWALPPEAHEELEDLEKDLTAQGLDVRARFFVKGATWRNFQARYDEANEMYAKMLRVSEMVAAMPENSLARQEATKLLYQGQCNCPYWHGVFGGLYLPHLRNAIYERLIRAETLVKGSSLGSKSPSELSVEVTDHNMDGHDEVLIDTGPARLALKPAEGGHIFEYDLVSRDYNVMATLTRRREAYHRAVLTNHTKAASEAGTTSIHDAVRLRDPEIRQKIVYDWYKKESLIDHFFAADTELKGLSRCRYKELGDFVNMPYALGVDTKSGDAKITMKRDGALWLEDGRRPLLLEKTLAFAAGKAAIEVEYRLTNENDADLSLDFGVEFNLALLGGKAPDRYYLAGRKREKTGNLSTLVDIGAVDAFAAVDEWKQVEWWLEFSKDAALWAFPVETASMSEYGIELVYQCSTVIPHWRITVTPGSTWSVKVSFAPRER